MEHRSIQPGQIHAPHNWEFADAAARTAAVITDAELVGRIALQLDESSYWLLTAAAPATWAAIKTDPRPHAHPEYAAAGHNHDGDYDLAGTAGAVLALHASAPDPHPQYLTLAEADQEYAPASQPIALLNAHEQASNPHQQYSLNGHDHAGAYEPAGAVAAHEAASDPHTGYQKESEKGQANGYASLDGDGKVPAAQLPAMGGGGRYTLITDTTFTGVVSYIEETIDPAKSYQIVLDCLLQSFSLGYLRCSPDGGSTWDTAASGMQIQTRTNGNSFGQWGSGDMPLFHNQTSKHRAVINLLKGIDVTGTNNDYREIDIQAFSNTGTTFSNGHFPINTNKIRLSGVTVGTALNFQPGTRYRLYEVAL